MTNNFNNLKRTKMCGQFSKEDVGQIVVTMGFVSKYRNLGSLIFIDLRDKSGIVQLVFSSETHHAIFENAERIRNEFVISIEGTVRMREPRNINSRISTGEIEILVQNLKILSEAETLPFAISDETNVNESLRLKYRYLDLRRPILQKYLAMRNKISLIVHNYMNKFGFIHVETPILGKSTPEGARDYLVPSRVNQGAFYALPQSPQLYKQLLMIAGLDRYYQIAKCFRDEDLRANRQPEFTQIDIEMSYVDDVEDVMTIAEGLIRTVFKEAIDFTFPNIIPRLDYKTAMEKYGSDKPDTRYGLQLFDLTDIAAQTTFSPFIDAINSEGIVKGINLKSLASMTRKEIDSFNLIAREYRAKGVFTIGFNNNEIISSLNKHLDLKTLDLIKSRGEGEDGDIFLIVADQPSVVFAALGAIRIQAAKKLELVKDDNYSALWINKFPLYEFDDKENRLVAMHHPFTSPLNEDLHYLDSEPLKVRAKAYDLVINGQEVGGGSIRIHTKDLQNKMFSIIGLKEEDIKLRFGFFTDAFKFGVPPHGGIAFGLDRLVMLLSRTDNIKDVIAFPKNQSAQCLMSDAPSEVELSQLRDLFPEGKVF